MLSRMVRLLSLFMCLILVLTGCNAVGTGGNNSEKNSNTNSNTNSVKYYLTENEKFNYYNNTATTPNNNDDNDNDNNNDNDSNSDNKEDNSSKEDTVDKSKPISSGEWKQERFYLSSCIGPNDYESLVIYKEAGFNLAEGAGKTDVNALDLVENANKIGGIYVLVNNKARFTLDSGLVFNERYVRESIYKYAELDKNRLIIGYTVHDEPVFTESFPSQDLRMISYLNKYDPNSLKFINMLPSYGVYTWDSAETSAAFGGLTYEEFIDKYIKLVDPMVLALDYYPYHQNQAGDTGNWFRDMGLFRDRSIKHNKPFWYYYQVVNITASKAKPTNAQILYQMNVGLAYGAKCLMAWNQDVVSGAKKTEYFEDTKARHEEIMKMGTYLLDKTTTKIYHTGAAANYTDKFYLDKLAQSDLIATAPSRVIMSVFEDGKTDTKYLMVVSKDTNLALEGTITLKGTKDISIFNKETATEESIGTGSSISINIKPGGGEIYILK